MHFCRDRDGWEHLDLDKGWIFLFVCFGCMCGRSKIGRFVILDSTGPYYIAVGEYRSWLALVLSRKIKPHHGTHLVEKPWVIQPFQKQEEKAGDPQ